MNLTVREKVLLWIWLSLLPRYRGIKLCLIQDIPRLYRLWEGNPEELSILQRASQKFYEGVLQPELRVRAEQVYEGIQQAQIGMISLSDPQYPPLLKATADAPVILYYKGDITLCHPCISVIGSRKATAYGLRAAEQIAAELAGRGICIVSGMARGIDTSAHKGALRAGGKTCAVLGSGIDVVYPPENKALLEEICHKGVVLSEYAPGTLPLPQHFPARNRIISGLSQGVAVVEAGAESGTLITVDFALEQGREVFAVPGNIYSLKSRGTNQLIKDGAHLLSGAEEIIETLHIKTPENKNPERLREQILETIESGMLEYEFVMEQTGCTIQDLNRELFYMEMEGWIIKSANGEYTAKNKK